VAAVLMIFFRSNLCSLNRKGILDPHASKVVRTMIGELVHVPTDLFVCTWIQTGISCIDIISVPVLDKRFH